MEGDSMKKNTTKMIAIAAVGILLVAGIGAAYMVIRGSGDKADITIAVGTKNYYEPFWIADHYGLFKDEGINVDLMLVSGGGAACTALLSGQVDTCLVGASDPTVRLMEESKDGKIISGITTPTSVSGIEFAIRDDAIAAGLNLSQPNTFFVNGANGGTEVKYHVGLDTTTGYRSNVITYFYRAWQNGTLTDEQYAVASTVRGTTDGVLVHMEFDNQVIGIVNGGVDAIIGGNTNVLAASHDGISLHVAPSEYTVGIACVILASGQAVEEKRDALVKMLRALDKACAMIENPETVDEVADYCVEFYGAATWDKTSQMKFFDLINWDVNRIVGIEDTVEFNAYLLGYDDRDYSGRFDWSFVAEAHDEGELYIYDPETKQLMASMP